MITYRSILQHFGEWWHDWFNLPKLPWGKRLQDMMWRTHGSNFPTGHDRTKMVDFTHRTVGFQEGISMNTNYRIDSIWNTPFIITIIIPLLNIVSRPYIPMFFVAPLAASNSSRRPASRSRWGSAGSKKLPWKAVGYMNNIWYQIHQDHQNTFFTRMFYDFRTTWQS